jgi:hypothetical protein
MCNSGDSTKKNASSHCSCEALGRFSGEWAVALYGLADLSSLNAHALSRPMRTKAERKEHRETTAATKVSLKSR